MKKLLILLTCIAFSSVAQKVPHSIVNGAVKITGVDGTNPCILDNDFFGDTNEGWYLWLKANRKEVNLVGNIVTKCGHPSCPSHDENMKGWNDAFNAANQTGMKNIPQPIKGSSRNYNGSREESAGSNLIIAEAKKASPQKPLVIFVGGQVTSIANAWLKDNSIGPNIVVIQIDGFGSTDYNAIDRQSAEIVINNMRYINWDGDLNGWYEGAGFYGTANHGSNPINRMPGVNFNTPNNPFGNAYKSNTSGSYQHYGSIADSPGVLYFFNNNLWENVVKKNMQNQTVTGENYNFLLVSKNRWNDYGPQLSNYMNNPANYIPVTGTTPPVEPPPVTQTPFKTLTIPGKIEAEDFDNGGEGVAYHDSDVVNSGGKYRTTGVDIEGDNSFNIGWTSNGEWLEYTTNVTSGNYKVDFRVASIVNTGRFEVLADNVSVGAVSVPNTGAWQAFQTVSFNATLTGGTKVLRINILSGDLNIESFTFSSITPPVEPPVEPPVTSGWLFDVTQPPFNAKSDGIANDGPAIQAAIYAAIKAKGKVIIPPAKNFYKTTQTIFIRPIAPESQAYISIEGNGNYWQQIVYQGPSGQPAVVIEGLKQGSVIERMHVKIGDGVSNSAAFDIGTNNVSGSTSGFSFRNCTAETNRGVNNVGFRVGLREGSGADVSQIDWYNCAVNGPFSIIPGQKGFHFAGGNSFLFNIFGGSTVFCETGISVTSGGTIATFGYGSSQNGTELYMAHSTQVSMSAGRFESSKKFLKVEGSANFPGVRLSDMVISDFKNGDGKLFEFLAPGGLIMDNVKIENSYDYGSGMITLGNNGGTLSVRGGAFNATDPFLTQGGWRAKIENVVRLNRDYQSVGYFTNK